MNKNRLWLYVCVSIISIFSSLLFTFLYGSFQHQRYWDGTIMRVQDVEANLVKGFFSLEEIGSILDRNETKLEIVFEDLKEKIPKNELKK